ncbi:hypothetical protein HAPAU_41130 [Halalkalicoccus paucihalophilus]|uniref:DUF7967 domain-containing protein n=1 Tax=Halalkalicoccus paucihalophilus TaxID=1008153 RepID=A0A151A8W0_9EURY|nr:hypothetical protein [Halalkalicoccus paucihalophilus]KYH24034.1 hypothetical protein HAPAU_41130 [Halalkalicoccus paucihalophilus]
MASEPNEDKERVWLVERGYNNRDLIILKYAISSGEQVFQREVASQALDTVTAARDVAPDNLASVDEPETQERYATEVERMKEKHEPDDPV